MPKDYTPHISHHISLELFTAHYSAQKAKADDIDEHSADPEDAEPSYYTHPCRCSGEFVITYQDLEDGIDVVGCGGCGEWVRVGYEVAEDNESEDEDGDVE